MEGKTQETAAAIEGMSERSARKCFGYTKEGVAYHAASLKLGGESLLLGRPYGTEAIGGLGVNRIHFKDRTEAADAPTIL